MHQQDLTEHSPAITHCTAQVLSSRPHHTRGCQPTGILLLKSVLPVQCLIILIHVPASCSPRLGNSYVVAFVIDHFVNITVNTTHLLEQGLRRRRSLLHSAPGTPAGASPHSLHGDHSRSGRRIVEVDASGGAESSSNRRSSRLSSAFDIGGSDGGGSTASAARGSRGASDQATRRSLARGGSTTTGTTTGSTSGLTGTIGPGSTTSDGTTTTNILAWGGYHVTSTSSADPVRITDLLYGWLAGQHSKSVAGYVFAS